jgi:hypothetical protein
MDVNFYNAIQELNDKKVSYWVCHGTLLGLSRDGDLIPWDHDIDLAIWESEYSKEYIIEIFELIGFEFQEDHPKGSLSFKRSGGRSIDINLYKKYEKSSSLACALHLMPAGKIYDVLDRVVNRKKYTGKPLFVSIFKFIKFFRLLLLPLYYLLNKLGVLYTNKGYTTPMNLLIDFIDLDYFGISCRAPKMYKSINSYIYGEKWLTPNKKYNWMTDSTSVTTHTP